MFFKARRNYFVSYAHPKGFGNCVVHDIFVRNTKTLHKDFAAAIQEKENLNDVVVLNWIRV